MTELSIRRENTRAKPPRIMALTVLPVRLSAMKAPSTDSGMEKSTATVARMLPRKIRIMTAVRIRPSEPSWIRFSIAVRTKTDWSNTTLVTSCAGTSTRWAIAPLIPFTTAIVLESPPCFSTGR